MTKNGTLPSIFIVHENPEWIAPFANAFERRSQPFEDWCLTHKSVELDVSPPQGIFYNRMSASSFSRGNNSSPDITNIVLRWLERSGRRIINSRNALQLEISKAAQLLALQSAGVPVPKSIAAMGHEEILRAIDTLNTAPIIIKPNRGGKGLGVELFEDPLDARKKVSEGRLLKSVDGITIIQEYIRPADGTVTRAEFIAGRFHYAVVIDASKGFELCPAEACSLQNESDVPMFQITLDIDNRMKQKLERFLAENEIEIAGIEFSTDRNGDHYVYDVNTNTNYNVEAESLANQDAPLALVDFLIAERNRVYSHIAA